MGPGSTAHPVNGGLHILNPAWAHPHPDNQSTLHPRRRPLNVMMLWSVVVVVATCSLQDQVRRERLAIVVTICAGVDYMGNPPNTQLERAQVAVDALRNVTRAPIDDIPDFVLISSGFTRETLKSVHGFTRIVDVPLGAFSFKVRSIGDGKQFACQNHVQPRLDGKCTAVKLTAWNLTEYDGILHQDSDVCLLEDPRPLMRSWKREGRYFGALVMPRRRAGKRLEKIQPQGFFTNVMYLQPNKMLFQLLRDKAASGDFRPFTNTEQDVLDTVFSMSTQNITQPRLFSTARTCSSCAARVRAAHSFLKAAPRAARSSA